MDIFKKHNEDLNKALYKQWPDYNWNWVPSYCDDLPPNYPKESEKFIKDFHKKSRVRHKMYHTYNDILTHFPFPYWKYSDLEDAIFLLHPLHLSSYNHSLLSIHNNDNVHGYYYKNFSVKQDKTNRSGVYEDLKYVYSIREDREAVETIEVKDFKELVDNIKLSSGNRFAYMIQQAESKRLHKLESAVLNKVLYEKWPDHDWDWTPSCDTPIPDPPKGFKKFISKFLKQRRKQNE